MGICDLPGAQQACDLGGAAVGNAANAGFKSFVDDLWSGFGQAIKEMVTLWQHVPSPDLTSSTSATFYVSNVTAPLVAASAVFGLVVAAVRLMRSRPEDGSVASSVAQSMLLLVLTSAAGALVVSTLTQGFDELAGSVMSSGFDGVNVGQRLGALAGGGNVVAPGLAFIPLLMAIAASIVQTFLLIVRGGILAILVGILPIAVCRHGRCWRAATADVAGLRPVAGDRA